MMLPLVIQQVARWDERRSGVPGEHWAAFGTGVALLGMARPGRPPWLRAVAAVAGVAMIWRAASGRDGFLRKATELAGPAPAGPGTPADEPAPVTTPETR